MFWDRVAGVYDLFANVYNAKTHKRLKQVVADQISADDAVLEGRVPCAVAVLRSLEL